MINDIRQTTRQQTLPGIIGGLGPLAHIEFERRLLAQNALRGACHDQDHPVWIVVNATDTPDRTESLMGNAKSCVPWLVRYGRMLQGAGVDFLVITCNTSHAFYEEVQPQLTIPWIHLMTSVSQYIRENYSQVEKVGILATDGTLKTQLYEKSLKQANFIPIYPQLRSPIQEQVMQAIYHPEWGIKAAGVWVPDLALEQLSNAMDSLKQQGAELVIAGCTELSVAFARMATLPLPYIDPLDILATITLDLAFGQRKL